MLDLVYTCQNATLLEIICHGSYNVYILSATREVEHISLEALLLQINYKSMVIQISKR